MTFVPCCTPGHRPGCLCDPFANARPAHGPRELGARVELHASPADCWDARHTWIDGVLGMSRADIVTTLVAAGRSDLAKAVQDFVGDYCDGGLVFVIFD